MDQSASVTANTLLKLELLGGFSARIDSARPIEIKSRRVMALLAILALSPDKSRTREEITGLLWSDRGSDQARASLRQALTALRKALAPAVSAVRITDDSLALILEEVAVDAVEFELLADSANIDDVAKAVTLYKGDLLARIQIRDEAFEEWLGAERARLRGKAIVACIRLIGYHLAAAEWNRVISAATTLLGLDPANEAGHRALIQAHAGRGEKDIALHCYAACVDILARELDTEPEARTKQLAAQFRAGDMAGNLSVDTIKSEPGEQHESLPLPDKPSVAVLPFANMSSDPEQGYFAEGVTENIVTGLTRFDELFVIAWHSSLVTHAEGADAKQAGRRLGVAHIVEGSVRKAGNRVRVTAQLIEAASGHRVWADHYDRDLDDIFAVQDEIGRIIVATLAGRIEEAARHRAMQKPVGDMVSYDYVLRGRQCMNRGAKDDVLEARRYFERARELDPRSATACANLAVSYIYEYESLWAETRPEGLNRAYELAQEAVALDRANSAAWCTLAWVQMIRKQHELSRISIESAIALNPNDHDNLCTKGWCLALSGDLAECRSCLNEALRVNPFAPTECLFAMGIAEYRARHYEAAIGQLGKISGSPMMKQACLAACYAQLGREREARAAAAEALELAGSDLSAQPEAAAESLQTNLAAIFHFPDSTDFDHLIDGLRKAGVPM